MNVRRQFSQRDAEDEGRGTRDEGGSGLHKRWFSFRAEELGRHQSRNKGGAAEAQTDPRGIVTAIATIQGEKNVCMFC